MISIFFFYQFHFCFLLPFFALLTCVNRKLFYTQPMRQQLTTATGKFSQKYTHCNNDKCPCEQVRCLQINLAIVKFFSDGAFWNANDLCCDPRLKAHADRNCTGRTKIRKKSPKIKVIHLFQNFIRKILPSQKVPGPDVQIPLEDLYK